VLRAGLLSESGVVRQAAHLFLLVAIRARRVAGRIVVYHGIEGELYDLVEDPDEFTNPWSSPALQALQLEIVKACFDSSAFTLDPATHVSAPSNSPIPAPE
jgi:hypothetical protein